jgi:hypothetical protein
MRRTIEAGPTSADPDPGASMHLTTDREPDEIVDGIEVFFDGIERTPAERQRICARWRDLFARIRREIDAAPGEGSAREEIVVSISIVPGRRTPAQDAAMGALLRRLIARDEATDNASDPPSSGAVENV